MPEAWGLLEDAKSPATHLLVGKALIGRLEKCTVCISDDQNISAVHASLAVAPDENAGEVIRMRAWVEDRSTNGVYVNGEKLGKGRRLACNDGDVIALIKGHAPPYSYVLRLLPAFDEFNACSTRTSIAFPGETSKSISKVPREAAIPEAATAQSDVASSFHMPLKKDPTGRSARSEAVRGPSSRTSSRASMVADGGSSCGGGESPFASFPVPLERRATEQRRTCGAMHFGGAGCHDGTKVQSRQSSTTSNGDPTNGGTVADQPRGAASSEEEQESESEDEAQYGGEERGRQHDDVDGGSSSSVSSVAEEDAPGSKPPRDGKCSETIGARFSDSRKGAAIEVVNRMRLPRLEVEDARVDAALTPHIRTLRDVPAPMQPKQAPSSTAMSSISELFDPLTSAPPRPSPARTVDVSWEEDSSPRAKAAVPGGVLSGTSTTSACRPKTSEQIVAEAMAVAVPNNLYNAQPGLASQHRQLHLDDDDDAPSQPLAKALDSHHRTRLLLKPGAAQSLPPSMWPDLPTSMQPTREPSQPSPSSSLPLAQPPVDQRSVQMVTIEAMQRAVHEAVAHERQRGQARTAEIVQAALLKAEADARAVRLQAVRMAAEEVAKHWATRQAEREAAKQVASEEAEARTKAAVDTAVSQALAHQAARVLALDHEPANLLQPSPSPLVNARPSAPRTPSATPPLAAPPLAAPPPSSSSPLTLTLADSARSALSSGLANGWSWGRHWLAESMAEKQQPPCAPKPLAAEMDGGGVRSRKLTVAVECADAPTAVLRPDEPFDALEALVDACIAEATQVPSHSRHISECKTHDPVLAYHTQMAEARGRQLGRKLRRHFAFAAPHKAPHEAPCKAVEDRVVDVVVHEDT